MNIKAIILGVIVIILLYVIFRYIFSSSTQINGLTNAKTVTKIDADDITSTSTANYAYSVWFYIDDWSYRYGEPKIVLGRLDDNLHPSPSIVLGAIENNLQVSVSCYPKADSTTDIVHKCNVANIPLQRWVNAIVSLYGRTLDIYIDGKLVRTCVLPGVAKISTKAPVYVTPGGGFSGYTANIHYYDNSLNPQEAYNIYRLGYSSGFLNGLGDYSVKLSFYKDEQEQSSVEI
mgnify:FL=1